MIFDGIYTTIVLFVCAVMYFGMITLLANDYVKTKRINNKLNKIYKLQRAMEKFMQ